MASIHTLIADIYAQLEKRGGWFSPAMAAEFGGEVARRLTNQFEDRERRGLRLSGLGPKCPRHLWHSINHPELAEPIQPWAINKFCYGHILEAWAIALAKAAGHTVEGEQDELIVDGIVGHRDCIIDGCVVDVKSSSSQSFTKFSQKTLAVSDSFGYLDQLDGYLVGSYSDPKVIEKNKGYLLAIDKQLGHMVLYEHECREEHIRRRISEYKRIVERTIPPACTCETRPSGKSGNVELGVVASYSPYKWICFPKLRSFSYADKPRYLSHVERVPDVPEINREGRIICG